MLKPARWHGRYQAVAAPKFRVQAFERSNLTGTDEVEVDKEKLAMRKRIRDVEMELFRSVRSVCARVEGAGVGYATAGFVSYRTEPWPS